MMYSEMMLEMQINEKMSMAVIQQLAAGPCNTWVLQISFSLLAKL